MFERGFRVEKAVAGKLTAHWLIALKGSLSAHHSFYCCTVRVIQARVTRQFGLERHIHQPDSSAGVIQA